MDKNSLKMGIEKLIIIIYLLGMKIQQDFDKSEEDQKIDYLLDLDSPMELNDEEREHFIKTWL